jgi:CelD/BcsL family acetyltransferase involved in cellulose biosynthesis
MSIPSALDSSNTVIRVAAPSRAHPGLQVREYGLTEALERFSPQWHDVLRRGDYNISLAPEFVKAASASVGLTDSMRVLVAHHGADAVGFMPFHRVKTRMMGVPMTMLRLAGNLIAYHHELVALDCHAELLRACFRDTGRWHVFCAESIPVDGPTCRALHQVAREVGSSLVTYPNDVAPYLPIAQTWDQFLAGRSGNFRYNLKRKEKALKKGGSVEERWFTTPDDVPELYRCMEAVESQSWKSAAQVAVTSKSNEALYYREILPFLARNGMLFANVIYVNGNPAAYHLCYFFQGRVGNMKTSFDEAYQELSPGAVIIQHAIQRAFTEGAKEFDFLGDDQYHKRLWTEETRPHRNHYLFSRDLRSQLIGRVKAILQKRRKAEFHAVKRRSDVRGEGE